MRVFAALLLLALSGPLLAGIESVLPERYTATEMVRLAEYFTGEEHVGDRFFVRADPDVRAGLYMIVDLEEDFDAYPAGTSVRVEVVTSSNALPLAISYTIEGNEPDGDAIHFGLSGLGDIAPQSTLLAWKVTFLSPEGDALDSEESYLWQAP